MRARLNLEHGLTTSTQQERARERAQQLARPTYEGIERIHAECWVTSMKRQTKIVVAFFVRSSVYVRRVVVLARAAPLFLARPRARRPGVSVAALIVFASKRRYDIYMYAAVAVAADDRPTDRPPARSIRRKPRRMLRIARGNRKAVESDRCVCVCGGATEMSSSESRGKEHCVTPAFTWNRLGQG